MKKFIVILFLITTAAVFTACNGINSAQASNGSLADSAPVQSPELTLVTEPTSTPEPTPSPEPTPIPEPTPSPGSIHMTGDIVTFTMQEIPPIKYEGLTFAENLVYTDEFGNAFSVSSAGEWFENASFLEFPVPEGTNLTLKVVNSFMVYSFDDVLIGLALSVDGARYDFGFGMERQFIAVKTDTGYALLPEETLKVNPPPNR